MVLFGWVGKINGRSDSWIGIVHTDDAIMNTWACPIVCWMNVEPTVSELMVTSGQRVAYSSSRKQHIDASGHPRCRKDLLLVEVAG